MKIIGKTQAGFLVDMTIHEIVRVAGYRYAFEDGWKKLPGVDRDGNPSIGSEIAITAISDFHARITADQQKARDAASTLRALAGLLDGAMPDVVLPPIPTPTQEG